MDDHPANLLALEAVLEPLGARLVRASSGAEALRLCDHEEFALILLDVQMPGLDGFETARRKASSTFNQDTPILFLTAMSADEAATLEGYGEGAVDYIAKPFEPRILLA